MRSATLVGAISAIILASSPLVSSATCKNWTDSNWRSDSAQSFESGGAIPLETLACPSGNKEDCIIQAKKYDLTIERKLNISTSAEDADAIFTLAQQNFGVRRNDSIQFITRSTQITSQGIDRTFREVPAGKNSTLSWQPYEFYSSGRLDGCDNATLNGVYVLAQAPYVLKDKRNNSVVQGGFVASIGNVTSNGNRATPAGGLGRVTGILAAVGLAVLFSAAL